MTVYEEALGKEHPHVAGTMKNIGMVLAEQGQLDEAMTKFQEAQRIYKALNNGRRDGPCCDVASALSCMGNVQNRRGEFEDALRLYDEALSIYKSVSKRAREMGGRSRLALQEVASTLKIMGMVHTKRGKLDHTMACFQDAIDILRQNFNEKGSGLVVTSILSRIGGIFSKMGELDEAMSHYHEAYDLATRTYGTADRPEVAQVLHHIGGVHQRQGNHDEAMRCYKNAAKVYQARLGRNDPTVATTLVCIGSLHYVERNLDGAMNYYKQALRLNRAAYGTKHPDVIPTMKSIALIHAKRELRRGHRALLGGLGRQEDRRRTRPPLCDVRTQAHPECALPARRFGRGGRRVPGGSVIISTVPGGRPFHDEVGGHDSGEGQEGDSGTGAG